MKGRNKSFPIAIRKNPSKKTERAPRPIRRKMLRNIPAMNIIEIAQYKTLNAGFCTNFHFLSPERIPPII
jgi:hypothetical protein